MGDTSCIYMCLWKSSVTLGKICPCLETSPKLVLFLLHAKKKKKSKEKENRSVPFNKLSIIATDAENVITSSAKDCSNDLCGSVYNPSDPLPQHSVHKNSTKTSLSSDLEYLNSKSNLNGVYSVMISHIESPYCFYIHIITNETNIQMKN